MPDGGLPCRIDFPLRMGQVDPGPNLNPEKEVTKRDSMEVSAGVSFGCAFEAWQHFVGLTGNQKGNRQPFWGVTRF